MLSKIGKIFNIVEIEWAIQGDPKVLERLIKKAIINVLTT